MKVYSVWTDKWDYDEYDEFIVVANNEDSALTMVIGSFEEYQRPYIHIKEVDLTTEHVVLGSFNAG